MMKLIQAFAFTSILIASQANAGSNCLDLLVAGSNTYVCSTSDQNIAFVSVAFGDANNFNLIYDRQPFQCACNNTGSPSHPNVSASKEFECLNTNTSLSGRVTGSGERISKFSITGASGSCEKIF
jgi:hypothetical protein